VIVSIGVVMVVAPIVAPVVVPAVLAAVVIIALEASVLIMIAIFVMIAKVVMMAVLVVSAGLEMLPEVVPVHVAIARHVYPVVPIVAHEIDAARACTVFATVRGPVPLVTGGHTQVERRGRVARARGDDHGLGIDDCRRCRQITDAQLAIETRLTDSHGH